MSPPIVYLASALNDTLCFRPRISANRTTSSPNLERTGYNASRCSKGLEEAIAAECRFRRKYCTQTALIRVRGSQQSRCTTRRPDDPDSVLAEKRRVEFFYFRNINSLLLYCLGSIKDIFEETLQAEILKNIFI